MTTETRPPPRTWETISQRLREALNPSTYDTWFGGTEALEASPRAPGRRRPQRIHQDLDRGPLRQPPERRRRRARARASSCASPSPRPPLARPPSRSRSRELRRQLQAAAPAQVGAPESALHVRPLRDRPVATVSPTPRRSRWPRRRRRRSTRSSSTDRPGLGKTHLLQAVAQYVMQQHPYLTVRYVTTETVLNEFVDALRDKSMVGFKGRYRSCDVLLIDDIQFIEGKNQLQEEFFHTFNSLYEAGKQIIISSDRQPRELATLEARLRTRFEWGLITDVQPPDRRDAHRDPAQEGRHRRSARPRPRGADVHRRPRHVEHPRARGRADPRDRVRVAHGPADLGGRRPARS